jgi:hypothetical protein
LGCIFQNSATGDQPYFGATGLYHILLQHPVAYDLVMDPAQNFLFLTGANMAGKSTLIKAIGSSVFLAHMGMGVPAHSMELSVFDGLLSNINVADNIVKGESYFFNEVQRIKTTINKINDGKKWLVLIDELFKGTNVQDAMKCSLTVIKGLIKIKNSLFILSTHLYEIGEELKQHPNISFKYFETEVSEEQLQFSYQLKEGISNDRIGYVILHQHRYRVLQVFAEGLQKAGTYRTIHAPVVAARVTFITLLTPKPSPLRTTISLMRPTAIMALSGGLMMAVNSSMSIMPRLEMVNVLPENSAGCSFLFLLFRPVLLFRQQSGSAFSDRQSAPPAQSIHLR